jgi:hypothetical protein
VKTLLVCKPVCTLLCLFLITAPVFTVFSQDSSGTYEAYQKDEFPEWAHQLRRGEVLFFGSLPFTLFATNIGFDFYNYASNDFNAEYLPLFSPGSGGAPIEERERFYRLTAALAGSLLIVCIDYIIGYVRENRNEH